MVFELDRQAYVLASKLLEKFSNFWVNYSQTNWRNLNFKLYEIFLDSMLKVQLPFPAT